MSTRSVGATNVRPHEQIDPVVDVGPFPSTSTGVGVFNTHPAHHCRVRELYDIDLSDNNTTNSDVDVETLMWSVSEQSEKYSPPMPEQEEEDSLPIPELNEDDIQLVVRCLSLRPRQLINYCQKSASTYDNFSETSSVVGSVISANSEIRDPTYRAYSKNTESQKRKRKLNIKRKETPPVSNVTTASDSHLSSISVANLVLPNEPLSTTSDWVITNKTRSCSPTGPDDRSAIATPTTSKNTSEQNKTKRILKSDRVTKTSTPNEIAVTDACFKIPQVPIRFTKNNKACPTHRMNNLIDLLHYQADKYQPACSTCKRCVLIKEYNIILHMLPESQDNEPDILEATNVFTYDFVDVGLIALARGRDLVYNVLTSKSFPIWLCNIEMDLKKSMFHEAHKLQTLKRNLLFDTNDTEDEMVNKVRTRISYLASCIIKDHKELSSKNLTRLLCSLKLINAPARAKKLKRTPGPRRRRKQAEKKKTSEFNPRLAARHCSDTAHAPATPSASTSASASVPAPTFTSTTSPDSFLISLDINESFTYESSLPQENMTVEQPSAAINDPERTGNPSSSNTAQINRMIGESPRVPPTKVLVYRPTVEEFQDLIAYIAKIEEQASKYGICKIIPPKGLISPCHLDDNSMFTTINQYPGRLYQRWGLISRQLIAFQIYAAVMAANVHDALLYTKLPLLNGVKVDLVKLYHLVHRYGGIEKLRLRARAQWDSILSEMCISRNLSESNDNKLKDIYNRYILSYESLSYYDRQMFNERLDSVWSERYTDALRRSGRPFHSINEVNCDTIAEDEDEPPLNIDFDVMNSLGKDAFDRSVKCTGIGQTMNLATFRRIARQTYMMHYRNGPKPTLLDIENDFWNIVAFSNEHVNVQTAFINTSADAETPGRSNTWNLKRLRQTRLSTHPGSGKTLIVTDPKICLTQVFSTNCWHMDPNNLAWIDYVHKGTTKIWYAVPQSDSQSFCRAVQALEPTAVNNNGTWLASDTIMIPPNLLNEQGVKLQRLEQNPGEFIVVFPGSYSSSISTGMTISESTYFQSKIRLNSIDKIQQNPKYDPTTFSNPMSLLRLALDPDTDILILPRVLSLIKIMFFDEFEMRFQAYSCKVLIIIQNNHARNARTPTLKCSICGVLITLSMTEGYNQPHEVLCLKDAIRVHSLALRPPHDDDCSPTPVTLFYTDEEMLQVIRKLEDRIIAVTTPKAEGPRSRKNYGLSRYARWKVPHRLMF